MGNHKFEMQQGKIRGSLEELKNFNEKWVFNWCQEKFNYYGLESARI
jgi:hypothetical protein